MLLKSERLLCIKMYYKNVPNKSMQRTQGQCLQMTYPQCINETLFKV